MSSSSVENNFKFQDLVWVKKRIHYYPGMISEQIEGIRRPSRQHHYVFFFGSDTFSWIKEDNMLPYNRNSPEIVSRGLKITNFRIALAALEEYANSAEPNAINEEVEVETNESNPNLESVAIIDGEGQQNQVVEVGSLSSGGKSLGPKKKRRKARSVIGVRRKRRRRNSTQREMKQTRQSTSAVTSSDSFEDNCAHDNTTAVQHKENLIVRSSSTSDDDIVEVDTSFEENSVEVTIVPAVPQKDLNIQGNSSSIPNALATPTPIPGCSSINGFIGPSVNKVASSTVSELSDLNSTKPKPTNKIIGLSDNKFGFLGYSHTGSGMIRNLLNASHKVTLWNQIPEKYEDFIAAGADQGITPFDVASSSDIIFSAATDPSIALGLIMEHQLLALTPRKSYVEMTRMDPEYSLDIADAIASKGGRYLEVQVEDRNADNGGPIILMAAGDRSLYNDCFALFRSISEHCYYFGDQVGEACKMNLVIQLFHGVALCGLAEGMALADRSHIPLDIALEIIKQTSLASDFLITKSQAMIHRAFAPEQTLERTEKDMRLVLKTANQFDMPFSVNMASTANEILKRARCLELGDKDESAVFMASRF